MPKVSKDTASIVKDFGLAEDRSEDLDDYTVSFVTIKETHDLAPILKSLPTGDCQCPHWGYVFRGRMTVQYGDHEEAFEAGDAYYMPPGHAPAAEAGSEFVMISPAKEFAELQTGIAQVLQAMRDGAGD
jgi:mannose-6-phosphate isomerase-like protein (cupin superfamily)